MGEHAQSAFTGVRMPLLMEQEHDPRDFTSLHFDAGIRVTSLEFVQGLQQTCTNLLKQIYVVERDISNNKNSRLSNIAWIQIDLLENLLGNEKRK